MLMSGEVCPKVFASCSHVSRAALWCHLGRGCHSFATKLACNQVSWLPLLSELPLVQYHLHAVGGRDGRCRSCDVVERQRRHVVSISAVFELMSEQMACVDTVSDRGEPLSSTPFAIDFYGNNAMRTTARRRQKAQRPSTSTIDTTFLFCIITRERFAVVKTQNKLLF